MDIYPVISWTEIDIEFQIAWLVILCFQEKCMWESSDVTLKWVIQ
jgi:hypothetical protein